MFYKLLFIIVLVFFSWACIGQDAVYVEDLNKENQNAYKNANQLEAQGKYSEALFEFEKLYTRHSNFIEALIRMGEIQYKTGNLDAAEETLTSALEIKSKYTNKLHYTLGSVFRANQKYGLAAVQFRMYLIGCNPKSRNCSEANKLLEQCEFGAKLMNNALDINPRPLPPEINSSASEYLTSFNIDQSQLIFTRRINNQEDLYISHSDDGNYSSAVPLIEINTNQNEGAHCISADGSILIFTGCQYLNSYGGCDLYYSVHREGKWSKPVNLGPNINSEFWDSQPSLSSDGHFLFFSSNRRGGIGGRDIWMSELQSSGLWSPAFNLGKKVNTDKNESSPFIHANGENLYFRSNGHLGIGDYDIFLTKKDKKTGEWSTPENLGYPINTHLNEGALTISSDGNTAYFAKEVETKSGIKHLDIYQFELPESLKPRPITYTKVNVMDFQNGKGLFSDIILVDIISLDTVFYSSTDENGGLVFPVDPEKTFLLQVFHPDYVYHAEHITLSDSTRYPGPFNFDIYLHPLFAKTDSVDKPVVLNNIFFESGSDRLNPVSNIEIMNLSNFLKDNPGLKIKILGHTDNIGNNQDNLVLSRQRAQTVYEALITMGIDRSRLLFEGRGETQPLESNDTEEGRQNNRRTEFIIVAH